MRAVGGVDLQVQRGEVVALIGESGSGKSVTLRSLLRLHPPRRTQMGGQLRVGGQDVLKMSPSQLADYRGKVDLDDLPGAAAGAGPGVHAWARRSSRASAATRTVSADAAQQRALELFERVRIPSPERRLAAYPHEMTGGMRQRAMIALALACQPQLLLADEPTTALDATVQIQILLLLRELQREIGLSVIFVTHDIGAALEVADRIAVMYAGRIVEVGSARALIREPRHPYTLALLKSRAHGALAKGARLETIGGAPPDLSALPPGCAFAERCSYANDGCRQTAPEVVMLAPDHGARCLRTDATAESAIALR